MSGKLLGVLIATTLVLTGCAGMDGEAPPASARSEPAPPTPGPGGSLFVRVYDGQAELTSDRFT